MMSRSFRTLRCVAITLILFTLARHTLLLESIFVFAALSFFFLPARCLTLCCRDPSPHAYVAFVCRHAGCRSAAVAAARRFVYARCCRAFDDYMMPPRRLADTPYAMRAALDADADELTLLY